MQQFCARVFRSQHPLQISFHLYRFNHVSDTLIYFPTFSVGYALFLL